MALRLRILTIAKGHLGVLRSVRPRSERQNRPRLAAFLGPLHGEKRTTARSMCGKNHRPPKRAALLPSVSRFTLHLRWAPTPSDRMWSPGAPWGAQIVMGDGVGGECPAVGLVQVWLPCAGQIGRWNDGMQVLLKTCKVIHVWNVRNESMNSNEFFQILNQDS